MDSQVSTAVRTSRSFNIGTWLGSAAKSTVRGTQQAASGAKQAAKDTVQGVKAGWNK